MKLKKQLDNGFTLIEIMITVTILSFISLAVYQNVTSSFNLREKLELEGEFYNSIRVAMGVIEQDIIHIYSPQEAALFKEMKEKKSIISTNNNGVVAPPAPESQTTPVPTFQLNMSPTKFWGAPINGFGVKPSRFQGEEMKMSFITNGHLRIYKNSQETHFSKIIYELGDDKYSKDKELTKALIRRENTSVFSDEDWPKDTETETPILSNVKSIRFQFLDETQDKFLTRWDTVSNDAKGAFPAIIEVTIELFVPRTKKAKALDPTEHTFKVTQWFKPELLL